MSRGANAAQADRRFKDVRHLANAFLFDFHDAIASLPGSTPAREMVVKTAREYLDSLAQEVRHRPRLWSELSTAYLKLGDLQGRPSASRTGDTDGALRAMPSALTPRRRLAALEPANTALASITSRSRCSAWDRFFRCAAIRCRRSR